jgi:hypothetical protein
MILAGRKGGDQAGIVGGEQAAAERADDVEGLGMLPIPDVVENQKRGALGEQLAQLLLADLPVVEQAFVAQLNGELTLEVFGSACSLLVAVRFG